MYLLLIVLLEAIFWAPVGSSLLRIIQKRYLLNTKDASKDQRQTFARNLQNGCSTKNWKVSGKVPMSECFSNVVDVCPATNQNQASPRTFSNVPTFFWGSYLKKLLITLGWVFICLISQITISQGYIRPTVEI